MIKATNIRVASFDLDRLDIRWEIEDTGEDVRDYDFYVLRGGSPLGPYSVLTPALVDRYHFRDIQVGLLHQWHDLYYRIRVVRRTTGDTAEYPEDNGVQMEARPDLIALEIRKQEEVLFREHVGRLCWLFKKRTFGQRCPNCYEEFSQRKRRSHCPTCYGTSYAGGFHYPIQTWVQFDPSPESEQLQATGKMEQTNTTARGLWFPVFSPGDVVVEATNDRWRVYSQSRTERLRAVVHQMLQLHAVIKGDIEYALPLDVDEGTLQPSPARDFTNPYNPGEGADGIQDLLDLYRSST